MIVPPLAVPAVATGFVFTTIALLIVCFKVFTRVAVIKNVGAEDFLIVAAMVSSIIFLGCVMFQIDRGLGAMITFEQVPGFLQAMWFTVLAYTVAMSLIKISITVQLLRLFRAPAVQRLLRGFLIFLCLWTLWAFFSSVFTCVPVDAYWNVLERQTATCLSKDLLTYLNSIVHIITDLVLVTVPLFLLRKLQIPKRQKLILLGVFAIGFFACITSMIRLNALYEIANSADDPVKQTIFGVNIAVWSCIEINTSISCSCIPALKPLVVKYFPKLLPSLLTRGRRTGAAYGTSNIYAHQTRSVTRPGAVHTSTMQKNEGGAAAAATSAAAITVAHTFEMSSVPVGSPLADGRDNSRDGSEKALVLQNWKTDCYAAATDERPRPARGHENPQSRFYGDDSEQESQ